MGKITSARIDRETLELLYRCRDVIAKKHGRVLSIGDTIKYLAIWYLKLYQKKQEETKKATAEPQ